MSKQRFKLTETAYAEREKCDIRTIRNWKRDGAPLDDPQALALWKSTRQHLPPGTLEAMEQEAAISQASVELTPPRVPQGASHALKRLEGAEASAYEGMQDALKRGNPHEIKAAREHWLRVGESLRRFDLIVEANRRDSGQLIPKEDVENALKELGFWLRLQCQKAANEIAVNVSLGRFWEDPSKMNELLTRVLKNDLLTTLSITAARSNMLQKFPWIFEALKDDLKGTTNADELESKFENRRKVILMLWDAAFDAVIAKETGREPQSLAHFAEKNQIELPKEQNEPETKTKTE